MVKDINSPEDDRRDAETNRMAAEDARVATDKGRTADDRHRVSNRRKVNFAQLGAYALIVLVAMVSFNRIEQSIERNTLLTSCLTEWVMKNTGALQDRDAVNTTARAAEREMWGRISQYLSRPEVNRKPLLNAIKEYRTIEARLSRQESINPYPEISRCLSPRNKVAFGLMSASTGGRTCFGRQPTIFGTKGDDVIHGTDGRDVISALGGDDLIIAGKGKDLICGGRGDDMINGGQHFDKARGGRGVDVCIQVESTRSCR